MENITDKNQVTYKDYTEKINKKINTDTILGSDINELIVFLNYSFREKNNFFIENFNQKSIKTVYLLYNQLKTNILVPEITEIFYNITIDKFKVLRFILINTINNFEIIKNNNDELCQHISEESFQRVLKYINILYQLEERK